MNFKILITRRIYASKIAFAVIRLVEREMPEMSNKRILSGKAKAKTKQTNEMY